MKKDCLNFRYDSLQEPKPGERLRDCEDAIAEPPCEGPGSVWRFAMSDGVSASSFSRQWAQILTQCFVDGKLDLLGRGRRLQLLECRRLWLRQTADVIRKLSGIDAFFAEEKRQAGAYATLLGVTLADQKRGWKLSPCASIQYMGDSCSIFHPLRGRDRCFPNCPAAFKGPPPVIGSVDAELPRPSSAVLPLAAGDVLILCTDALARWYLGEGVDPCRARRDRLPILRDFFEQPRRYRAANFRQWLEAKRAQEDIEADDVSVTWIEFY